MRRPVFTNILMFLLLQATFAAVYFAVGWIGLFLAFKDARKLDAETVEGSLGKLECKGVTGKTEYTSTNGRNNFVTFTNRLHEKAPFGVVSSEMRHVNSSDGKAGREAIITIKLIKVGKNAKSELPDAN